VGEVERRAREPGGPFDPGTGVEDLEIGFEELDVEVAARRRPRTIRCRRRTTDQLVVGLDPVRAHESGDVGPFDVRGGGDQTTSFTAAW
jgi:hypothetical protein